MLHRQLSACSIGSVARDVLTDAKSVIVSGATSRGLFLCTNSGWVLFISKESARGPLTINLHEGSMPFEAAFSGMSAQICKETLSFPDIEITLILEHVPVYTALPPQKTILHPGQVISNVSLTLEALSLNGRFQPKSPLLDAFRFLINDITDTGDERSLTPVRQTDPYSPVLETLSRALKLKYPSDCCSALIAFLGLGQGLTPSGDDLVMGFLLAINRYQSLCPWLARPELNQLIISAAYHGTTRLSANLIECAASGQADERLVSGLDGLVSPHLNPDASLSQLAGWGSSSGLDAWVGMALALLGT